MMVRSTPQKSSTTLKIVWGLVGFLVVLGIAMTLFFATHPSWVGEQSGSANYIHKTFGLVSDMPHLSGEIFIDIITNSVTFIVVGGYALRKLRKEHENFDRIHGIDHKERE